MRVINMRSLLVVAALVLGTSALFEEQIYSGSVAGACSAALKCTPLEFCTTGGVISNSPVDISPERRLYSAPLIDCKLDGGRVGKCCRDPNYTDPWPADMLGKWIPGIFEKNGSTLLTETRTTPRPIAIKQKLEFGVGGIKVEEKQSVIEQGGGGKLEFGVGQYEIPGEVKQVVVPGKTIVVEQGGGGQIVTPGQFGYKVIQGGGQYVSQAIYRVFLQPYYAGAQCGLVTSLPPFGNHAESETDFAQYPWQAMILEQDGEEKSLRCGGVITRPEVVLTSAACVDGLAPEKILVKAGEWKLAVDEEPLPFQIAKVKQILYHPYYKSGTYQYDVAVLLLAENLEFSQNIYPICMPTAEDSTEALYGIYGGGYSTIYGQCVVTGWGKEVLQAHRRGAIMHDLNVTLIKPDECQARINKYYPKLEQYFNKESSLCAEPANPLNNICSVDIGSALACPNKDGHYVLRAIYSWDSGCQEIGNQLGAFYKFDFEWYQWALGLLESEVYAKYTIVKPGKTIVVEQGGGGQIVTPGKVGYQVVQGVGQYLSQSIYRIFLQPYEAGAQCGLLSSLPPFGNHAESETDFAQYPWQAMILEQDGEEKSLRCGGVITRPEVVLTSAACVDGLAPEKVLVKGGEWKLAVDEEPLPFQIVKVKQILYHPFYQSGTYQSDVVALILAENFRFSQNIYPICLPSLEDSFEALYGGFGGGYSTAYGQCVVTGWGKEVLQAHRRGAIMHDLNVTLIKPDECQARINKYYPKLEQYFNKESSVCAEPANPHKNICSVDIGSALACPNKDGHYVLRAIYSWDSGCQEIGNQLGAFYKFDLEWYLWALGLIENERYNKLNIGALLAGAQGKIKVQGDALEIKKEAFGVVPGEAGLFVGKPQIVSYTTQPKVITYTTRPELLTYTTKPKIVTYTTKPEIVTYTTKPKIVTYTTQPKIVTYTTKPEIVTYTTKPKIITYTTKPKIVTYTTQPKIVTYTTQPKIVTYTTQPKIETFTTEPKIYTYTTKPEVKVYTTKPEFYSYTTRPQIISYGVQSQDIAGLPIEIQENLAKKK